MVRWVKLFYVRYLIGFVEEQLRNQITENFEVTTTYFTASSRPSLSLYLYEKENQSHPGLLCIFLTFLIGPKKLAPLSVAPVFPPFKQFGCFYFELSLVFKCSFLSFDWLLWFLWFWFNDTQSKSDLFCETLKHTKTQPAEYIPCSWGDKPPYFIRAPTQTNNTSKKPFTNMGGEIHALIQYQPVFISKRHCRGSVTILWNMLTCLPDVFRFGSRSLA